MMNVSELLKRAIPAPEPLSVGTWGTLLLRPDLGSQQEFIVGAAAGIRGDQSLHVKWLPSLSKLSKLYGEATSAPDLMGLIHGCERALVSSFRGELAGTDLGTPHVRLVTCGYFSADNVDVELTQLLKRHAYALWQEPNQRDDPMNDDWAYSEMLKALESLKAPSNIIIPGRNLEIGKKQLNVAFNNGRSYGTVVSARYAHYTTIERHILLANMAITTAHRLAGRDTEPALFVVLPSSNSGEDVALRQKSIDLLSSVEDSGIKQYSNTEPALLAKSLEEWATK
jgi:hypothetical protein